MTIVCLTTTSLYENIRNDNMLHQTGGNAKGRTCDEKQTHTED